MKALKDSLAVKNLTGRPGRSMALAALSLLLSLCIMAGSLTLIGLKNGLNSLDSRLGADVMVVPYEASTQNYLEDTVLMGNSGYYYMSASTIDDIRKKVDGVEKMSPQLYVASTKAGCCSQKVSIVGFDPETDFTVTPWVQDSYTGTIHDGEIFIGTNLAASAGDTLTFFGVPLKVAAKLDETGTYLDTAVYANMNTVKTLIKAAKEKGLFTNLGTDINPDTMISSIMIKAYDEYDAATIQGEIKTYIRKVATVKTESSVEDVSDKLAGIQSIALILIAAVWLLIIVIEAIAFRLDFSTRTKELAILRMTGASRRDLSHMLMGEAAIVTLLGSIMGTVLSVLVMRLFSTGIRSILDMPFLLPGGWSMTGAVLLCIIASVAVGLLSAAFTARKAAGVDAALILRGEN